MAAHNVFDNLSILSFLIAIDEVRLVESNHGSIGGNGNHTERVGAHELGGFGFRSSRHTGKLLVEAEVVLKGNRGKGLVLCLNLDAFFGLNGLVNTLVIAATGQDTAGVLINDEHFAVHHDVVLVTLEQ